MVVLRTVTVGTFAALALYAVVAGFMRGAPVPPTWAWAVAESAAPAALAVYWRPAYRVPDCFFLTGASAFFIGLVAFSFGAVVAPVMGLLTLLAMPFAPRDGGWRARWGRDDAADDVPT